MTHTASTLNATSKSIWTATRDIRKDIQSHLSNLLVYIMTNRDCSPAYYFTKLLTEERAGKSYSIIRAAAIKDWLEEGAFCRPHTDKKTNMKTYRLNKSALDELLAQGEEATAEYVKRWSATKWNEYKADPEFKGFDLDAAIKAAIKKAEEAVANDDLTEEQRKKVIVPADKLAALKALVA